MIQGQTIQKEITLNYDLAHILIQKTSNGLKADVQLTVTDQDGNFIESLVTSYEEKEYNKWWDSFNSWNDVLTKILPRDVEIPSTIEDDLINK